jgi:hypothetical protein
MNMAQNRYRPIDVPAIATTRNALHAYARHMGNWLKVCRLRRKHWWHASLRPSLVGLTTGVVYASIDFEIVLNLQKSLLQVQTSTGQDRSEPLDGQSAAELGNNIKTFLVSCGLNEQVVSELPDDTTDTYSDYSAEQASVISDALCSVTSTMTHFRAGIREETSPIQLWPHHFDLSMLWLPGDKVPDRDLSDEDHADKQVNFGFTFGDEGIPEPYFYITAYPFPEALPAIPLPPGATWQSEGFSGVVLLYKDLIENNHEPERYLLALWRSLLKAGREHMLEETA